MKMANSVETEVDQSANKPHKQSCSHLFYKIWQLGSKQWVENEAIGRYQECSYNFINNRSCITHTLKMFVHLLELHEHEND